MGGIMNRKEQLKVTIACSNLKHLLTKDPDAVIPAEEVLDWLGDL